MPDSTFGLAACVTFGEDFRVPTAIDLFCGDGGITEGFRQAGFSCLYGNDSNQNAIQTFWRNLPGITAFLRIDRFLERALARLI